MVVAEVYPDLPISHSTNKVIHVFNTILTNSYSVIWLIVIIVHIYSCESDFHSKEEAKLNEVMDSVLNIGQTCLPSWAYHAFQRSNHNLVSLLFIFVFLTFNYQAKNQSLTGLSFVKLFLTTEIIICI